ncbi:carbamate kinase [Nostocoides australiense]|uniref:Carbamate kinase n=1 Tax=Nostocoides australiense Ben110 TaxID=1193182 RepID=W6K212_9MICO|nr:carbamate kinase [Tetrasphaera australiensis]MCA0292273.1 carbamate kinase [Actinomycetota bacterium]CCH75547.1 putative Carbamate kinase (arcC) [Tetrasphaera australiensis Ben110]HPF81325.1 carbamate kinase [Tetrasphaera australiensis]HRW01586.1 carbamate kinase [Tetrasphaera sp.]
MRIIVALGGNAMTAADGSATPQAQIDAIATAMTHVAELVVRGHDVVLTHGNGPQVGNLLVKNELAANVVPPVPLDWCGAQTQGTIGFTVLNSLEAALRRHGVERPVAALISRTLVDGDDEGFATPTKPVGRYLSHDEAKVLIDHGQTWEDRGEKGWRRVVASPEPLEVLETGTITTLLDAGYLVVAAGGGGIPVVRDSAGELHGVEAVIDKDLTAAVLAKALDADVLVIATDVENVMVGWGTPQERALEAVTVAEMRQYAADDEFASGSMGPKVEAALRFIDEGGRCSVITSLDKIGDAIDPDADDVGTVITPG